MDAQRFEHHLLALADEFLRGAVNFDAFKDQFYWNGYLGKGAPTDELSRSSKEFFDDVCERMDHAGENDLITADDRKYGYINSDEFRAWLTRNLDAYLAGTYVAGDPLSS